jgi:hypothetical protein
MGSDRSTPRQLVITELRRAGPIGFVFDSEKIADQLLAAIADRMRDEVGPRDCSCGGCDSCAQHALIDWLDPE